MDPSLLPFFHSKGVVIVGASTDPAKLGWAIARNLVNSKYPGSIAFVNPKGGELFGHTLYHSVAEAPDPLDLAVLIVPAASTPSSLMEIAMRGIRAVIISSGGFREVGPQGTALEAECLDIAHKYKIRMIGPNCIGLIDYHLPLDTSFVTLPSPPKGNLALISQSGAVCGFLIDWVKTEGFGFSRLLSLGNEADVTETDMLPGVVEDENTHAITFYIESIHDGRHFVEEARQAARHKPLVALKVGKSSSGKRAAASHTGALAGEEKVYAAAFSRAGVLQASTIREMFDWATALATCPLPNGNRIAILTDAGGPGVIASDALDANRLTLAEFTPETIANLAAMLPSAASLHNPVDILGSADRKIYTESLRLILADPGVDGVVVILPPPPVDTAEQDVEAMIPLIHASPKPVVFALMGGETIQKAAELLRQAHIPEYRFSDQAVSALAALVRRAEFLRNSMEKPRCWENINLHAAKIALAETKQESFIDRQVADRLMSAYGIPVAPVKLARTEAEAISIAEQIGYPVVMKIASPDIIHKSDVSGVLMNVHTAEEVRLGFQSIMRRTHAASPEACLEGVHIQHMVTNGQEVIIGAKRDPQFGPLVMFGSGGVEVEGLKDVAFALAPLLPSEASDLLQNTWAGRKLAGFRNIPPGDSTMVEEILQRLAQMVFDLPEIEEIEINPLYVLTPGGGAIAVDVRIKLGKGE
jgi:acetate---CoA ligase (ADP-forming)